MQLTRCFTIKTASFELLLEPAAFLAKSVRIVAGGEFIGTHALFELDVASEHREVDRIRMGS